MASRRSGKSTRANFNEKVVEDIRSQQAQAQAQKVAQASFDQSERIKLAQQQQASQARARQERSTRASEQIKKAQQVSQQSKTITKQISRQSKSTADKGVIQTTSTTGNRGVTVSRANALADRVRKAEQQRSIQQAQQRQVEAKKMEKPIDTTSLSSFSRSFSQPTRTKQETKAFDLAEKVKVSSKGRSSQFGQTVQSGQGKTLGEIRVASRKGIKTPNANLGVRTFLEEKKLIRTQPEDLAHDEHSQQGQVFAPTRPIVAQAGLFGTPAPTLAELQSVLPSRENPFRVDESVSVSQRQIPNPKAGEIISVEKVETRLSDGSIKVDTITKRQPEFLTETVRDTSSGIVEQRPEVNPNPFLGFLGGVVQEGVNFGNIADIATGKGGFDEQGRPLEGTLGFTRKEVGSTVIGLPFEVGGALLTKERSAGEGFFGLGFDFDFNLDRAFEKSGEEQKFIAEEFERDPARALGSTFAAVGTEVALIVGTGGTATIARKGVVKAGQFAQKTKQAQQASKIAKTLIVKGEENLPRTLQSIGDNKFVLTVGTDALKGAGTTVVSPSRAIITGITKAGKVVQTKVPLLKFGGKAKGFERVKGAKTIKHKESDIQAIIKSKGLKPNPQNPKSARQQAIEELNEAIKIKVQGGVSQNPITVIDLGTKTRKPSVAITKRFVPKKATIEQEKLIQGTVTNVQDSSRFLAIKEQQRTGLKLFNVETPIPKFKTSKIDRILRRNQPKPTKEVDDGLDQIRALTGKPKPRGESTTVTTGDSRRLTDVAVTELKASEKLGLNKRVATSFVFSLDDVIKNPQVIKKIVSTERGLTGRGVQLPKTVKGAEKLQRQGKIPKKQQDTVPISFSTRVVFESKSTSIPKIFAKTGKTGKTGKGSTGKGQTKPESPFDDFTKTNKGKGGSQTVVKSEAKGQAKPRPQQNLGAVAQDIERGIVSGTKQGGKKIKTPFDSIFRATSVGTRTSIGATLAGQQSQVQLERSKQIESTREQNIFGSVLIPVADTTTILKEEQKLSNVIPPPPDTRVTTIIDTRQDFANVLVPIQEQATAIKTEQVTDVTTNNPPITTTTSFFPPVPSGRSEALKRAKEARARRSSKKGNRLFDVADTPFGKVEVGLGFFIEQEGDESIAEALGGTTKKKKKKAPIDDVFDPSGLFSF